MRAAFHNSPCHMVEAVKPATNGTEPDVCSYMDMQLAEKSRSKKGKAALHQVCGMYSHPFFRAVARSTPLHGRTGDGLGSGESWAMLLPTRS